jgi:monofunctional biosynthetic peptidoglycan transglycosylase
LLWCLIGVLLGSAVLTLPWRWIDPPTTAFMLQARLQRGTPVDWRWVPWAAISPALRVAVVAAEDQKFPTHHGFDLQSISSALREAGGRPRGASTISQQVAKNLFLWPGRSLLRKAVEAWLTTWIELGWPKRRILEVYLNVAELGPGVYGAEAASRRYFGKPARALDASEAALLAAVLPSPRRMSAVQPSRYVEQRAQEIEESVRDLGGPGYLAGL